MMDDETREASELSKDDLLRMKTQSTRANVARKMPRRIRRRRDINQRSVALEGEATDRAEMPAAAIEIPRVSSNVVIVGVRFQQEGPVSIKKADTTIN